MPSSAKEVIQDYIWDNYDNPILIGRPREKILEETEKVHWFVNIGIPHPIYQVLPFGSYQSRSCQLLFSWHNRHIDAIDRGISPTEPELKKLCRIMAWNRKQVLNLLIRCKSHIVRIVETEPGEVMNMYGGSQFVEEDVIQVYSQLVDIQQKAGEFTDEDFFNSLDPWYIEQDEEATDAICRRVGIGRRFKFDLSQVVNLLELARDPSTLDQYRAWSALEILSLDFSPDLRGRIFLGSLPMDLFEWLMLRDGRLVRMRKRKAITHENVKLVDLSFLIQNAQNWALLVSIRGDRNSMYLLDSYNENPLDKRTYGTERELSRRPFEMMRWDLNLPPIHLRAKHSCKKQSGLLQPLEVPSDRWTSVTIDFMVELPECQGEEAAWLYIDRVFRLHGIPEKIVSDRGTQFTAEFWTSFWKQMAYHPQSDGQTERVNYVLNQYFRVYCSYLQDDWVPLLATAEFAYNNSILMVEEPWPTMSPVDVAMQVLNGERLPLDGLDPLYVKIMTDCWQQEPADRPNMGEICSYLDTVFNEENGVKTMDDEDMNIISSPDQNEYHTYKTGAKTNIYDQTFFRDEKRAAPPSNYSTPVHQDYCVETQHFSLRCPIGLLALTNFILHLMHKNPLSSRCRYDFGRLDDSFHSHTSSNRKRGNYPGRNSKCLTDQFVTYFTTHDNDNNMTLDTFPLICVLLSIAVCWLFVACTAKRAGVPRSDICEEVNTIFESGEQLVSESRDLEERIQSLRREVIRLTTKLDQNNADIVAHRRHYLETGLPLLSILVSVSEDIQSPISKYSKPITHDNTTQRMSSLIKDLGHLAEQFFDGQDQSVESPIKCIADLAKSLTQQFFNEADQPNYNCLAEVIVTSLESIASLAEQFINVYNHSTDHPPVNLIGYAKEIRGIAKLLLPMAKKYISDNQQSTDEDSE
ncbi:retrotransposable element protein [Planoprotostelium fungivorum]|uniref:Retrotransposable element protein n=1 Tax=Planoprotostelium fungivorum TaxID=1890364 RepID=A0A2P6MZ92_9EUKA|nr:retrotransposable element protein [Planoprotostelium fungivorum]